MGGLARQAFEYLPLLSGVEVFKARVTSAGSALDVALQGVQEGAMAGATQQEIGAGLQMLLQLPTCPGRRRLDRALAHAGLPECQGNQRT